MKSISIIVPIYYGEKYIPKIIQQIEDCKSRLNEEDYLELLFVNDAPDAPLSQDLKSDAVHLTVINTDKNIGIHGARVKGLKKCHGEYVLFLDQDDRIYPEYFYSQLLSIEENDAVICKAIHAGEEYYVPKRHIKGICFKPLESDNFPRAGTYKEMCDSGCVDGKHHGIQRGRRLAFMALYAGRGLPLFIK